MLLGSLRPREAGIRADNEAERCLTADASPAHVRSVDLAVAKASRCRHRALEHRLANRVGWRLCVWKSDLRSKHGGTLVFVGDTKTRDVMNWPDSYGPDRYLITLLLARGIDRVNNASRPMASGPVASLERVSGLTKDQPLLGMIVLWIRQKERDGRDGG
jgi:hypothetical protein